MISGRNDDKELTTSDDKQSETNLNLSQSTQISPIIHRKHYDALF